MELFYDISVVILNLENSIFIERCLRSCLAQTLPGCSSEVIVISGKKNFVSDIKSHYERSVNFVFSDKELTFDGALREGLQHSSGRYIVFVDASDFISDYSLLFQSIYLYDNAQSDAVAVDYWLVENQTDRKIERVSALDHPVFYGIMYRKEVLMKAILLKGESKVKDGHALYSDLSKQAKIGHLPMSFYRRQMKENLKEAKV